MVMSTTGAGRRLQFRPSSKEAYFQTTILDDVKQGDETAQEAERGL